MSYNNGVWLAIGNDSHEKAEALARKLYDLDIPSKQTGFDELRMPNWARQSTGTKTMDEFFSIEKEKSVIRLNIGRTEYFQGKDIPKITFLWDLYPKNERVNIFCWFICNLEDGYEKFDETFREVYDKSWAAYPRS